MLDYAKTKWIRIVETYEEAESAFSDESQRPEFWRMVARATAPALQMRKEEIEGAVVEEVGRLFNT